MTFSGYKDRWYYFTSNMSCFYRVYIAISVTSENFTQKIKLAAHAGDDPKKKTTKLIYFLYYDVVACDICRISLAYLILIQSFCVARSRRFIIYLTLVGTRANFDFHYFLHKANVIGLKLLIVLQERL